MVDDTQGSLVACCFGYFLDAFSQPMAEIGFRKRRKRREENQNMCYVLWFQYLWRGFM
jgi:hypothetical protein